MSKLIFENPKRLRPEDIYLQILFGLAILFIVAVISPLRNHGQPFSWTSVSFLVFAGPLLATWIFNAMRETTLKKVHVEVQHNKVIFVLDRQLRSNSTFHFRLDELRLDIKVVPGRSLSQKKILTIRDNKKELKISSQQKELSENVLDDIVEKLKHYPQQMYNP
jgi:hypothetical protein